MSRQIGQAGESVREMENERFKKTVKGKTPSPCLYLGFCFLYALVFFPQMAEKTVFHAHGAVKHSPPLFQVLVFSTFFTVLIDIKMIGNDLFKKLDKKTYLLKKRQYQAARGAAAEETVGEILKELPDDFIVLHDVPSPLRQH